MRIASKGEKIGYLAYEPGSILSEPGKVWYGTVIRRFLDIERGICSYQIESLDFPGETELVRHFQVVCIDSS